VRARFHPLHRAVAALAEPAHQVRARAWPHRRDAKPQATKPSASASPLLLPSAVRFYPRPTVANTPLGRVVCLRNSGASTGSRTAPNLVNGPSKPRTWSRISATLARSTGSAWQVPAGSIYGLLGPNGAGKTTTCGFCSGIIDPSSGSRSSARMRTAARCGAAEVGYLPEERGLYPAMQCRDAIAFHGRASRIAAGEGRRRADEHLAEHGLGDWARKPIRTCPKAWPRPSSCSARSSTAALIVLDEPFSGLDAINQARLEELIRARRGAE
jgi:ABC-type glutathione transport system ATPase component